MGEFHRTVLRGITVKPTEQKKNSIKTKIRCFSFLASSQAEIDGTERYLSEIDRVLNTVQNYWPQYEIDGTRNIWILKPGAKSRGRGLSAQNFFLEI